MMCDRPQTQPRDRPDVVGNPEHVPNGLFTVEGHPADADAFGGRGQPQVLDGQTYGIQPGIRDGVSSQDGWCAAQRIVCHHDGQRGLHNAVDLDPAETGGLVRGQRRGEDRLFMPDMIMKGFPGPNVFDQDEVPWLTQADAGGGMGRREHTVQDVSRDRCSGELGTHVTAFFDHIVDVYGHGEAPALRPPDHRRVAHMRGRSSDSRINAWPPGLPRPGGPVAAPARVDGDSPMTAAGPCRTLTGFPILPGLPGHLAKDAATIIAHARLGLPVERLKSSGDGVGGVAW